MSLFLVARLNKEILFLQVQMVALRVSVLAEQVSRHEDSHCSVFLPVNGATSDDTSLYVCGVQIHKHWITVLVNGVLEGTLWAASVIAVAWYDRAHVRNWPLGQWPKKTPKEAKPEEPWREVWKLLVQIDLFPAFKWMAASLPEANELVLLRSFTIFCCGDDQTEKKPGILSASCCKGK